MKPKTKAKPKPGRNTFKRQLGPGAWEDVNGDLHISIPDMLKDFGLPNATEAQQVELQEAFAKVLAEHGCNVRLRYKAED
jgi:hypothetical protein